MIFKLLALLIGFLSAISVSSQTCAPSQGCNDPNAVSVTGRLPSVGIQKPTTSGGVVEHSTDLTVNEVVRLKTGTVTVDTSGLRPICVRFENGPPCPGQNTQTNMGAVKKPAPPILKKKQPRLKPKKAAVDCKAEKAEGEKG